MRGVRIAKDTKGRESHENLGHPARRFSVGRQVTANLRERTRIPPSPQGFAPSARCFSVGHNDLSVHSCYSWMTPARRPLAHRQRARVRGVRIAKDTKGRENHENLGHPARRFSVERQVTANLRERTRICPVTPRRGIRGYRVRARHRTPARHIYSPQGFAPSARCFSVGHNDLSVDSCYSWMTPARRPLSRAGEGKGEGHAPSAVESPTPRPANYTRVHAWAASSRERAVMASSSSVRSLRSRMSTRPAQTVAVMAEASTPNSTCHGRLPAVSGVVG